MFAIGVPGPMEMVIIGIIALLLFGPQLPKVARSFGQAIVEFKKAILCIGQEVEEIDQEMKK